MWEEAMRELTLQVSMLPLMNASIGSRWTIRSYTSSRGGGQTIEISTGEGWFPYGGHRIAVTGDQPNCKSLEVAARAIRGKTAHF
jgi:hypothetical protein